MTRAIIFDCEHLTEATSPTRFWCGPNDPDPLLAQIGAVEMSLEPPFDLGAEMSLLVRPQGRHGEVALPEFFTKFSGITQALVDETGLDLATALARFAAFAGDAPIFSWGKDEITSLAPSCFVAGLPCPIPVAQFGNAAGLLLQAGVPLEEVNGLRSHMIAEHFGIARDGRAHDGLEDALNVAFVLQKLLRDRRLAPDMFQLSPA